MVIAFFRTLILYLLLVAGIRLLGKRQVGELAPTDLVLALLISDLASVPMQDYGIPLLSGVIPIIALLCLTMILSMLTVKSVAIRALLCGRPSIIVERGEILQHEMVKNRFTLDELTEELRMQGVTDIKTVKYAILETNGKLSILLNGDAQPLSAGSMGLRETDTLPVILINDGRLLAQNLKLRNVDKKWLSDELQQRGCSVREVYLLSIDEAGTVFFARKQDRAQGGKE